MNPKIVFCDYVNLPIGADERMKVYKKCGVDVSPPWGLDFYSSGRDRFQVYDAAKRNDVNIDVVHLDKTHNNLLWSENSDGDEFCDGLVRTVEECALYGVKIGILHLSGGDCPPTPNAKGLDRLRKVINFCEKNNFIIAVENLQINEHFEFVLENIKSPNLKILFDIGHANCYTHDVFELFARHKDRIICTHLHNNHGNDDEHNSLDDGNIDFARFFGLDNCIQYHLFEVLPFDVKNAQELEKLVQRNVDLLKGFMPE